MIKEVEHMLRLVVYLAMVGAASIAAGSIWLIYFLIGLL